MQAGMESVGSFAPFPTNPGLTEVFTQRTAVAGKPQTASPTV
jgi:hypothetical protein